MISNDEPPPPPLSAKLAVNANDAKLDVVAKLDETANDAVCANWTKLAVCAKVTKLAVRAKFTKLAVEANDALTIDPMIGPTTSKLPVTLYDPVVTTEPIKICRSLALSPKILLPEANI